MDIGVGIQMMWPLAAQEAAAAGAAELEPGHFLCAALKLAEMPPSVLCKIVPDQELLAEVAEDQRELHEALEGSGVRVPADSTPLRRALRRALRDNARDGAGNGGGAMHRSTASRAVFARAEAAAREAGERAIGARCLMVTLLSDPDEALAGVLARIGTIRLDIRAPVRASAAWIDAYGCDLTARAREEQSDEACAEAIRRDAVCRVLADALFAAPGVKSPAALLVSRGERRAATAVNDVARWLVSPKPPAGARQGSILEIHSAAVLRREAGASPETRLEEVFRNAATCKAAALFFDDFHRYLTPSIAGEGLARRFQALLAETRTSCVMGMTAEQHEAHIAHAAPWRSAFRVIWVHDASPNFQL